MSLQLLVPVGSSERLHRIARRAESAKAALGLTYQLHPLSCSALAICFVVPRVTARTRASNTATRASLPDRHARRQQFVRQRLPSGCCNVSPRPSTTTQSGLVSQGGCVLPMLCYDECCRAFSTVSRTLCDIHVAFHGVSDRQIKVLRPSTTKLYTVEGPRKVDSRRISGSNLGNRRISPQVTDSPPTMANPSFPSLTGIQHPNVNMLRRPPACLSKNGFALAYWAEPTDDPCRRRPS